MTAADKAKLLALADYWDACAANWYESRKTLGTYAEGCGDSRHNAADELRALVAELGEGDG